MQAQRDGEGRRPLNLPGDSRRMLHEVKKSLSHLRQPEPHLQQHSRQEYQSQVRQQAWLYQQQSNQYGHMGQDRGDFGNINVTHRQDLGVRSDLAKSSPNLAISLPNSDKSSNMGRGPDRLGYHQKALAQIRQSIQEFQINDVANNGGSLPNGYDVELASVNPVLLMKLIQLGMNEEIARRALKLSGNKSVEAAIDVIRSLLNNDGRNGFNKIPGSDVPSFGSRVIRKPSFEKKYQTDSPVNSENSSIRSDSPVPNHTHLLPPYAEAPARMVNNTQASLQILSPMYDRQSPTPQLPARGVNGRSHTPPPGRQDFHAERHIHVSVPPDHVKQMIQRLTPLARESPHMRRPQSAQARPSANVGPMTAGFNGVSNAASQEQTVRAQHGSLYQYKGASRSQPNLAEMSVAQPPGASVTYNHPPPYPQGTVQHQQQTYYNSPANFDHPYMLRRPYGNEQDDSSSMSSSLSPSPAPQSFTGHLDGDIGQRHLPQPVHAWSAKQPPIFILKTRSHEIQKPVLQTATIPLSPLQYSQVPSGYSDPRHTPDHLDTPKYVSSVQAEVNTPAHQSPSRHLNQVTRDVNLGNMEIEVMNYGQGPGRGGALGSVPGRGHHSNVTPGASPHPGRTIQIQIQNQGPNNIHVHHHPHPTHLHESGYTAGSPVYSHHPTHAQHAPYNHVGYGTPSSTPRSESPIPRTYNQSPVSVISTTSTPSTNSDMQDRPPPPYPGNYKVGVAPAQLAQFPDPSRYMQPVQEEIDTYSATSETPSSDSLPLDFGKDAEDSSSTSSRQDNEKLYCTSPKPELSQMKLQPDLERQETRMRHFSPQAFKFYMEQHIENLIKSGKERDKRRFQLEKEMSDVGLSEESKIGMRKMLHQKESNYIRLKRAKMNKAMFTKINTLGVGAFGEVALVCKNDTRKLYAMKTLRKKDVYKRNQVAHVKAERDILAEADNEWVVKLYYSFQDKEYLYFVMDYIPGGDMMSLLIRMGVFEESLARFYIAELLLAIESVHKMGFIHRDIKPDNILIDKEGHIKLTDFGLCTGFRWTHSSKIYHQKGNHGRQDSMEPDESWAEDYLSLQLQLQQQELLKPLEQRRRQPGHRHLAHSLVGTPNYIAPEVLQRLGYTSCCDWWSVGVILYEMVIGQPPFLASTPKETQQKVIDWMHTLHIPKEAKLSPEAEDLILQLCQDAPHRLGRIGASQVKAHPFFRTISFNGLREQPAPYMPTIRSATDISNFDPVDPEKIRQDNSEQHKKESTATLENGKNPDHAFLEFTFRRFFDGDGHAYAQKVHDPDSNAPVYV